MRLVDLVIDAAALLNASRSVASKHIALRTRQFDAYGRTSSVAAKWREAKQEATQGAQAEPEESSSGREAGEKSQRESPLQQRDATTSDDAPIRTAPPRETPAQRPMHETADRKPSTAAEGFAYAAQELAAAANKNAAADADLPPGVDVNIFHTARGSKVLESLRKRGGAGITRPQPGGGGPSKEHPLRHWPRPPPVDINAPPTASLGDNDAAEAASTEPTSSPPSETPGPVAPEPKPKPELEPARPVETGTTTVDKETAEIAQDLATSAASSTPAYKLRESKVPASRFSRIWNYGGLAAGMLGGAMTETVSRAFGGGGEGSVLLSGKNMERLVAKLSRMRGAALKMGQMMSFQDSKMLPPPIQEVLQRVQDRADYMPAWQRDKVLVGNLGENWRSLFSEFEETPIAAASIGQVHKAVLKSNGKRVAVKIQFPGVADSINSDLDNLGILLNATKLLPKGLYLNKTIDNARLELGWECDYEREAQCAIRYKGLLQGEEDVFVAPDVHLEASGKQVLTMDFMDGIGVTRVASFTQAQRDWIGTQIMRLCLREITEFRFMQTDPNWTNFLYNAAINKLELLDFGASREYPEEFVREYVQLLEGASRGDRERVRVLSESLGYLTGHESKAMLDAHVDSVLTIAEPFLASAPAVYDFHDQTITERVKALIPLMLNERLAPPPEETYSLHRKLSGAFLLCAKLGSKVPCRQLFVDAIGKSGYVPK
ncbi:protein ABC1, mitochondrial precursor [Purpureocillium lavendulum]|uniref:Protein ABC1, mitochondrial n=1 Tax=Purpureocillium lavendulum TaxID=1247861 RepID=A0AB34FHJ2_9HYPO|nr:protein ABC1, mitochondrial precursor [Purpureocillium lavendulum]